MSSGVDEPPGRPELQLVALADAAGEVEQLAQRACRAAPRTDRGASTWPDSEYSVKPGDFSVPMLVNQSAPRFTIDGTLAIDSTLLTTVGQAYRPATAGNGGRSRGWPRTPSSESSSAVSSPQM